MKLLKPAIAGTLESSDVQITVRPNEGDVLKLEIQSVVMTLFGDAIRATILDVLRQFEVESAIVQVNDKGALDHVLRARMQAALLRAAESRYDWSREDR